MESEETLDFGVLLAPFPGERPAGDWLPDVHGLIERARRADDDLPQGDWKRETKAADWSAVVAIATDALGRRTKDVKIAGFLVEALVRQHGLPGARDGFRLLRQLQETFWDSLHPQIEEGDLEGRIVPLEWLNGKLPAVLKEVAVTRTRDGRAYSLRQWEESRALERLKPEEREQSVAEGKIGGEQFDKAVTATPRVFYETLLSDLDLASEELRALEAVTDEKFGRDAPSLLEIRKALEQCGDVLRPILKHKRELEPDAVPATAAGDAGAASGFRTPAPGTMVAADGSLAPIDPVDRADALRRLNAVAAFFRRTEPHSPIAYLVERATHWGRLPLDQWLREVIHDDGVLAQVRETLGLREPGGQAEGSS
jgi:type VI secretion system protein ImpA